MTELYLRTRYEDRRRGEVREREYADDGDVWVIVNGTRSLWCHFDPPAVADARNAIADANLAALADVHPTGADLATMSYEWWLTDSRGRFVNAAYPAVIPDEVDRLEEELLRLEEEATGDHA